MKSFSHTVLLLASFGFLALGSLWLFTPDGSVQINGTDADQMVEIAGIRPAAMPSAVTLDNGNLQVTTPIEIELSAHIFGSNKIEITGGPGAPITVAATDKFGQTFRARGERVVVWQGPLASGGVSSGPLRAALTGPGR